MRKKKQKKKLAPAQNAGLVMLMFFQAAFQSGLVSIDKDLLFSPYIKDFWMLLD